MLGYLLTSIPPYTYLTKYLFSLLVAQLQKIKLFRTARIDLRLREGKGKEERKLKERGREEQRSPEPRQYTLRDRE